MDSGVVRRLGIGLPACKDLDGTDQARLLTQSTQQGVDEIGSGGLAVGAGDAVQRREPAIGRLAAIDQGSQAADGGSRLGNDEYRYWLLTCQGQLARPGVVRDDGNRSRLDCLRNEVRTMTGGAGQSHIKVTGFDGPRIEGNAGHSPVLTGIRNGNTKCFRDGGQRHCSHGCGTKAGLAGVRRRGVGSCLIVL